MLGRKALQRQSVSAVGRQRNGAFGNKSNSSCGVGSKRPDLSRCQPASAFQHLRRPAGEFRAVYIRMLKEWYIPQASMLSSLQRPVLSISYLSSTSYPPVSSTNSIPTHTMLVIPEALTLATIIWGFREIAIWLFNLGRNGIARVQHCYELLAKMRGIKEWADKIRKGYMLSKYTALSLVDSTGPFKPGAPLTTRIAYQLFRALDLSLSILLKLIFSKILKSPLSISK